MRARTASTVDEVYEGLNKRQKTYIESIEKAHEKRQPEVRAALNKPREAVRKALLAGVPARVIAARLEVSPARVYQMREEAERFAGLAKWSGTTKKDAAQS